MKPICLRTTIAALAVVVGLISLMPERAVLADDNKKFITYVGPIDGSPKTIRRIAIVVEGDKFISYVCSKDEEFNKVYSRWLTGDVKAGSIDTEQDGIHLQATFADNRFSGTVTAKKEPALTFKAAAIVRSPLAGLYRATDKVKDADFVVGWIVDGLHNVVGSCQNKKSGNQFAFKPAKPLPPPPMEEPTPQEAEKQNQVADEVLIVQVDEEAETQVQAQKVKSVVQVPAGKKVPLPKKKK